LKDFRPFSASKHDDDDDEEEAAAIDDKNVGLVTAVEA